LDRLRRDHYGQCSHLANNPVVGVIDGFRWCILGGDSPLYLPGFCASLAIVAFLLWFGIRYFRATERTFADVV